MDFSQIISISGLGGLFKMVSQRGDGIIVTSLGEDQTRFVSSRKHLFTPLENISIYTDTDSVALRDVFRKMRDRMGELPLPDANASGADLKGYLAAILNDYDREKVYVSDIKKLIRWYGMLDEKGVLESALADDEESQDEGGTQETQESEATEPSAKPEAQATAENTSDTAET